VLCGILSVLLLCLILVPVVSAAGPASATPSATVPPYLLACSHAGYPEARFTCGFPGNESAVLPDGPPYIIACFDNSTSEPDQPLDSWKWEFGDGGTGTGQHPQHLYSDAGRYDISLTVTTWCGETYSNTTNGSIDISCSAPDPLFTTNVTGGVAPLAVQVNDTSKNIRENITTWTYWSDNTHTSNERNPVFVYTVPGTYTINETVWKNCVRLGSTFYAPYKRQIIVTTQPSAVPGANGTSTTPATSLTGAVPVATTSAVTSGVPVTLAATETGQNVPPALGTGTLSAITEPAGAQLYVDNILRGTSPATIPDLPAGPHTLRLERDGYRNQTVLVQVNDGTVTGFSATLVPESGSIAILPVIALALIILGVAGSGIYLYRKQKAQKD
jgi:hypothetical protein